MDTALAECRERLTRHRKSGYRIGEQNTKAMLIEPVLDALGWDLYDPEEVNREYRRRPSDNPVDYALLLMRTPRLFVEAKGLGENIEDPRWANQVISYAAVAGVEWVALTDGAEWRIYNAHAPVPVEEKLFRRVRIEDGSPEALDTLSLLSTDNMRENRIQELWRGYFIDRQVKQVLTHLFAGSEPPSDLVNVVAKRAERLSREDVRASLLRARATFDWPKPEIEHPALGAQQVGHDALRPIAETWTARGDSPRQDGGLAPGAATRRPQLPKQRVSPTERRLTVMDLYRSGRMRPGRIVARYDGREWEAALTDHGHVVFSGETYSSLSAAGVAVKIASRGPGQPQSVLATDGWLFWRGHDLKAGDEVTLKEIRRRVSVASPG